MLNNWNRLEYTIRITVGMQLTIFNFRALSALNNAYLGNVMGTNVVTHRDSNSSIFLHERARVRWNHFPIYIYQIFPKFNEINFTENHPNP